MPVPDAHARSRISLTPSRVFSKSIPNKFLPRILFSNLLFVFAIHAAKEWLLNYDAGIFWVLIRVLASGGIGVLVWEGVTGQLAKRNEIEWSALGTASLLQFVRYGCLFVALYRLSSPRVILFAHFSTYWFESLFNLSSPRKAFLITLALSISILADTRLLSVNFWHYAPGYVALFLHGIASSAFEHTFSVLSPSLGTLSTMAASTLGATLFALPLYLFRAFVFDLSTPDLPLLSLASIPLIAYSLLFLTPLTMQLVTRQALQPQYFGLSHPVSLILSYVLGTIAFKQIPSWTDVFVASLLYVGMYPEGIEVISAPPRTPGARLVKSYLKRILSNPESRKIFYFLMLNLSYMLIQMLYGIWTNSLGLISDAIHMAFDCMAIAVGLFASIMATWAPNERFTYGYGRVETLSGFANGIFLILISIFIIFEAIQRLMDPPEMNTSQLLLVSSLGLGVNLFGMFAMGGHHHHGGHSHSHGHSHNLVHTESHASHSHGHTPLACQVHTHNHEHSHLPHLDHSIHHDHKASHSEYLSVHSHSHGHSHDHSHLHPHSNRASAEDHVQHSHSTSLKGAEPPDLGKRSLKASLLPPISIDLANDDRSPSVCTAVPSTCLTTSKRVPNLNDHSHSHGHSHEGHSHNMRGVFLHVMADTLGSVGVIISTLLIQFYGWTGFDPIASLFIAILIAASVVPLVIDTGRVLALDVGDRDVDIQHALSDLSSIEGLSSYSVPRFWPKDSASLVGSIHIQLKPSFDPLGPHSTSEITYTNLDRVVENVDTLLREKISGLEELTIQVEGVQGLQ